jgi:hypothetical protein
VTSNFRDLQLLLYFMLPSVAIFEAYCRSLRLVACAASTRCKQFLTPRKARKVLRVTRASPKLRAIALTTTAKAVCVSLRSNCSFQWPANFEMVISANVTAVSDLALSLRPHPSLQDDQILVVKPGSNGEIVELKSACAKR